MLRRREPTACAAAWRRERPERSHVAARRGISSGSLIQVTAVQYSVDYSIFRSFNTYTSSGRRRPCTSMHSSSSSISTESDDHASPLPPGCDAPAAARTAPRPAPIPTASQVLAGDCRIELQQLSVVVHDDRKRAQRGPIPARNARRGAGAPGEALQAAASRPRCINPVTSP